MEIIFRRLGTYTDVPPTVGMTDAIMKVMVEVLCILAIATKEIKQSRLSKLIFILYSEMDQAFWITVSQKNSLRSLWEGRISGMRCRGSRR